MKQIPHKIRCSIRQFFIQEKRIGRGYKFRLKCNNCSSISGMMDIEEISDTQAGQSYGYRLGDPNQEPYVWVSYSGIVGIDSTPHRNRPYPAVTREDGPQVWPEGMGDVIRIMIQERPLPLDTATHFGWDNDLPPHAHEELMMAGRPAPRA